MGSLPVYALRSSEVFGAFATSPQGLPAEEVADRARLYGQNLLSKPVRPPAWRKWVEFVSHPMAWLLWGAGLVSLLAGQVELGAAIWSVILINASFSYWRENRAEQVLASLQDLLPQAARVVRGGQELAVPARDLVPGDLLLLAQGDQIPADARVIEAYGLRVNNAALTGEAIAARKTADASISDAISEIERPNLVFAGTSVVSGTARAIVFATGMLTQFGRISHLSQKAASQPSPLQLELSRVTRRITWIALGIGSVVFLESWLDLHFEPARAMILALGIIVAVLPEGLVPTVSLVLAVSAQRLAQKGVLVKRLSAIETLGTVSVICTDKSGTLTQNQMTVCDIWSAGRLLKVTGAGYEPRGEFYRGQGKAGVKLSPAGDPDLQILLQAGVLCNNARLAAPTPEKPAWTSLGDPTEVALRALAMKGGLDETLALRRYPRVHELPFDASRKRMSTIHARQEGETVYVKGAPKEVLQLCSQVLIDGREVPLDRDWQAEITTTNDAYARRALRVLALAQRRLPEGEGQPYSPGAIEKDLTFIGLVGMMDPPRAEVADAVGKLRSAGIRLVVVTGDYGLTAETVARRLGMVAGTHPRILTGSELEGLSDDELGAVIKEEVIYARMAPEHKLRLVSAFQAGGEGVAVIGDGVNDAPALRKADVGIAMGVSGTDVSKEASDILLIQDHFGGVVAAVEAGRGVYANLRKFITYVFSSNVPEILPFVMTALFNIPLALSVIQILAIDLGTDLLPALALGMESPEPGLMEHPPRRRHQPLIDRPLLLRAFGWLGTIEAGLCFLGFYSVYALQRFGTSIPAPWVGWLGLPSDPAQLGLVAGTVFFAGVITAQIGNAFTCRTENGRASRLGWLSNRVLLAGIALETLMGAVMIYLPPAARFFQHTPLPAIFWIGLCAHAPALYLLEKGRKWASRSFKSFPPRNLYGKVRI